MGVLHYLDAWSNVFLALALSGALSGALGGGKAHRRAEVVRQQTLEASRAAWKPCEHQGWQEKVEELAHRAFSLSALLDFYRALPNHMPGFDSTKHKTVDVVRHAIV